VQVTGRIVAVEGGRARVECAAARAGCSVCAGGRGCSWRRVGPHFLEVAAQSDGVPLRPGESVSLSVSETTLLRAAGRIYLPPVLGTVLGALLWRVLGGTTDAGAVAAAVAGFAAGHWLARALVRSTRPSVGVRRLGADPGG